MDKKGISVAVKGLSKSFGEQEVLKHVSFEVAAGELFVLMGTSGSGKSVLLKTLMGLQSADKGTITLNGEAANEALLQRLGVCLVFQSGALFQSMTVYDNLAFYHREHRLLDEKALRERIEALLKDLELEDAAQKFPTQLSGGMRKRVAIARALVMEPRLILYDEPTSELDPLMSVKIYGLIADLRKRTGATSIVVSHDRNLAWSLADRLAFLHEGELLAVGAPKTFQTSEDPIIQRFFNPEKEALKGASKNAPTGANT